MIIDQKVGNILSITDNLLTKTQNFGYDDLGRQLRTNEATPTPMHTMPSGNLTKLTDAGNAINYTYGQAPAPMPSLPHLKPRRLQHPPQQVKRNYSQQPGL